LSGIWAGVLDSPRECEEEFIEDWGLASVEQEV